MVEVYFVMLNLDTIFRLSSHTGNVFRHFKSGARVFMKAIGVLAVLVAILLTCLIYEKEIALQYHKITWEPGSIFDEVSPDMTKSDIFFIKGQPDKCKSYKDNEKRCAWKQNYGIGDLLLVRFEAEDVALMAKNGIESWDLPFFTAKDMKTVLGEENILSISKDYLTRKYTYLDKAEWGITFEFTANELVRVAMGNITWGVTADVSKYVIDQCLICPSEICPFDDKGKLLPTYKDKSYRDFLEECPTVIILD